MRLPRPCLSIRDASAVETLQDRNRNVGDGMFKDFFLRRIFLENLTIDGVVVSDGGDKKPLRYDDKMIDFNYKSYSSSIAPTTALLTWSNV